MEGQPTHLIDWKGKDWTPANKELAAHGNSRFTAPASQCPIISPDWEKPEGLPIDIIIFGGRRSSVVPLVTEAFDWDHGVFMGATAASEPTAAALDNLGIRYDPFAMLPFCGYNMGDYFQHWFEMGDKLQNKAPKIFYVNWFRKSSDGKFLWPGFGDNSRALKWMCERVDGKASGRKTAIGYLPDDSDLDLRGLDVTPENIKELLRVDTEAWKQEIPKMEKFFAQFGDRLPKRLSNRFGELRKRLG
jgi:phosphoenolpyruvate carboxykinase (GTP)